jgi:hypothetical protein
MLTVETSVVIAASDDPSSAAAQMFRRARAGDFNIAVSTRVPYQLTTPLADLELAAYIANVRLLPSPGRWDVSVWDGDVWDGTADRPNVSDGTRMDDDHLEAHRMSGNDHFVTLDEGQRKHALRQGLSALTPEALLARYPAGD